MAGTGWQSSDLLSRFQSFAGLSSTPGVTTAQQYQRLADAQEALLTEVATCSPKQLYGAPTAMVTADSGYTWTFGTDGNGYALFPLGSAQIFPSLSAVPDYPWRPNVDYLDEGVQIRLPNNVPYAGPLYWYGITAPQAISASVQPVIQPPPARILIVLKAVWSYAEEFNRNEKLALKMEARYAREKPKNFTLLRKHFSGARPSGSVTAAAGYGGGGAGGTFPGGYFGTGY